MLRDVMTQLSYGSEHPKFPYICPKLLHCRPFSEESVGNITSFLHPPLPRYQGTRRTGIGAGTWQEPGVVETNSKVNHKQCCTFRIYVCFLSFYRVIQKHTECVGGVLWRHGGCGVLYAVYVLLGGMLLYRTSVNFWMNPPSPCLLLLTFLFFSRLQSIIPLAADGKHPAFIHTSLSLLLGRVRIYGGANRDITESLVVPRPGSRPIR